MAALSFTAALTSIIRHNYLVYMRATTTAIAAGDYDTAVHWATFLSTFNQVGYCENKAVKLECNQDDPVEVNTGETVWLGFAGKVEMKYLQSTAADYADLDIMAAQNNDLLLVDTTNNKWIYVHNKKFSVNYMKNSGDVEYSTIKHEQKTATKAAYFSEGAIPTT